MKFSENHNPSLRPVLSKHRKIPSNSVISKENLITKCSLIYPLNIQNSISSFQYLFKPIENKKIVNKLRLPPLASDDRFIQTIRKISTPSFNTKVSSAPSEQIEHNYQCKNQGKRKSSRSRFFDHLNKKNNLEDISFGDLRENNNTEISKND